MSDEISELRKQLARGFARFVLSQGHGAICPTVKSDDGQPMTWQARGRQLYGAELFNIVLREEIARSKEEKAHAKERLSTVRGNQGEVRERGDTASGGENARREDHEQPRGEGAAVASEASAA